MPRRVQAAHARKCMRQETAIEPSTGSTPEFSKIEWLGALRSPMADEKRDRNCRTRSLSPRSCARRDPRQGERAHVTAAKRSTAASRKTLRKRKSQQKHARSYRSSSLRSFWRHTRIRKTIFLTIPAEIRRFFPIYSPTNETCT